MVEWYLFLPQVRLSAADIAERARRAEASGFDGMAFVDQPRRPGCPMKASGRQWASPPGWRPRRSDSDRPPRFVDAFRHPAVLAKQAVTLSDASAGRFELGLGAGSMPTEFARFDVGQQDPVARVEQLEATSA